MKMLKYTYIKPNPGAGWILWGSEITDFSESELKIVLNKSNIEKYKSAGYMYRKRTKSYINEDGKIETKTTITTINPENNRKVKRIYIY